MTSVKKEDKNQTWTKIFKGILEKLTELDTIATATTNGQMMVKC